MARFLFAGMMLFCGTLVSGGPIITCDQQRSCLSWSITQENSGVCIGPGSPCAYRVCMLIDQSNPGCTKSGSISHTCRPQENVCGGGVWQVQDPVDDGMEFCQTGTAGSTLTFLLKDGSLQQGCDSGTIVVKDIGIGEGALLSCNPSTRATCTGNRIGAECVWTVVLPASCGGTTPTGGCEKCPAVTPQCQAHEASLMALNSQFLTKDVHNMDPSSLAQQLSAYGCKQSSTDCNALQCDTFVPDSVLANFDVC